MSRPEKETMSEDPRPDLLSFTPDVLRSTLSSHFAERGQPRYRVRQVERWVYQSLARSVADMTDLPATEREALSEAFRLDEAEAATVQRSEDGTVKHLWRLADGELIESVLIPTKRRLTLCLSSQAGCAIGCTFCATGWGGFDRQLTAGEIVSQYRASRRWAAENDYGVISNIVYMGMGEPLANYDNTMQSIAAMNHGQGMNIGARHLTVSTVGLVPEIRKLAREPYQLNLAVSLHAPDDDSRSRTMPINKRYPIARLMHACRDYVETTNRRIFFEYVLLDRENDTPEHARKLAALLDGLMCHVNLIPVNATEKGPFDRPGEKRIAVFREILRNAGIANTVRQEKGIDINAGCGQLRARALDDAVEAAK